MCYASGNATSLVQRAFVPHWPQNFAFGGSCAPQLVQNRLPVCGADAAGDVADGMGMGEAVGCALAALADERPSVASRRALSASCRRRDPVLFAVDDGDGKGAAAVPESCRCSHRSMVTRSSWTRAST